MHEQPLRPCTCDNVLYRMHSHAKKRELALTFDPCKALERTAAGRGLQVALCGPLSGSLLPNIKIPALSNALNLTAASAVVSFQPDGRQSGLQLSGSGRFMVREAGHGQNSAIDAIYVHHGIGGYSLTLPPKSIESRNQLFRVLHPFRINVRPDLDVMAPRILRQLRLQQVLGLLRDMTGGLIAPPPSSSPGRLRLCRSAAEA